jgi:NAD(P)-dependent dehydrogenase (short-subunit alcohol dehydrogenase family)
LSENYRALVIGASGGIGSGISDVISNDDGCLELHKLSRRVDGFEILNEVSISDHASALANSEFDLIICATGALSINGSAPEKGLRQIDPLAMADQFAVNAIGPALVLKHFVAKLPKDRRCIFAFLSAKVGSIGDNRLGGWISYRASKAALNQIVRTAAIEIERTRPEAVVVALHPGTVATELSAPYKPVHQILGPKESATRMLAVLDGLTVGDSGGFFAYDGQTIGW